MPYKDPEKAKTYKRDYYKRNAERIKQRARQWHYDHQERQKQYRKAQYWRDPDRARKASSEYYYDNKEACIARMRKHVRARQARQHKAFIEMVDPTIVFQRDQGICGICQRPVNPSKFHIDHIVPLSRGGKHSYANTQLAHPRCNMHKGARLNAI